VRDDVRMPTPGRGQVRLQVLAAGVNNTDIWTREGRYGSAADPHAVAGWLGVPIDCPRIQGADIVGLVDQVGAGVDPAWTGRRMVVDPAFYSAATDDADVAALLGSERDGGFAAYVVAEAEQVHDVTGSPLADTELAALPIAYGTALGMLGRGRAQPGETVLVTGASGGVGVALVQLAHARGLRVLALSTADKADRLRGLGADIVLDRRSPSLSADVADVAPDGVDLVTDVVGGALFATWPGLLTRRGRVAVAGAVAGPLVHVDLRQLYLQQRQIIGSTMHTRADFRRLVEHAVRGDVRPPLAGVYPLEQIVAAQRAMRDAAAVGKVVIDLSR